MMVLGGRGEDGGEGEVEWGRGKEETKKRNRGTHDCWNMEQEHSTYSIVIVWSVRTLYEGNFLHPQPY